MATIFKIPEPRINFEIRAAQVRLIASDGKPLGIVPVAQALKLGEQENLDLVEIGPLAQPPVCRLLDYEKFRYEKEKKMKASLKNRKGGQMKEIKMRPKIGIHDLEIKIRRMEEFLKENDKVKVTVNFFGREMSHTEVGREIIKKVLEHFKETAKIEQNPQMYGHNLIMILSPKK
ncbi:MAG: translation initiation factor IF-3 [Elusimicrobiota bacterium]